MSRLLVMRLSDMAKRHPRQDDTHVCGECGAPVGIYPSGQQALARDPYLKIICNACAGFDPWAIGVPAARSAKEFVDELAESVPVKKLT